MTYTKANTYLKVFKFQNNLKVILKFQNQIYETKPIKMKSFTKIEVSFLYIFF